MMVESGVVDLYCGSSTNTEQWARYVSFSSTYFVAGVRPRAEGFRHPARLTT